MSYMSTIPCPNKNTVAFSEYCCWWSCRKGVVMSHRNICSAINALRLLVANNRWLVAFANQTHALVVKLFGFVCSSFVSGNLGSQAWLDPCHGLLFEHIRIAIAFGVGPFLVLACLATLLEPRPLPSQNGVNIPTDDYSCIATFSCEAGLRAESSRHRDEVQYIKCFLFLASFAAFWRFCQECMHSINLIQANQVKDSHRWFHDSAPWSEIPS